MIDDGSSIFDKENREWLIASIFEMVLVLTIFVLALIF